jgi:hypothetical protein
MHMLRDVGSYFGICVTVTSRYALWPPAGSLLSAFGKSRLVVVSFWKEELSLIANMFTLRKKNKSKTALSNLPNYD